MLSIVLLLFTACGVSGQVPSYVPTNGLVGWWPFNGNANDESGNGNDGTVNGATLTADRFGISDRAYGFDGVDDFINTQSSGPLGSSDRSLSVWLNNNSSSLTQILGYGYQPPSGGEFNLLLNQLCQGITIDVHNNYITFTSINLSDGNWHNVICTYNNSIGSSIIGVRMYVDGVLLTSINCQNPVNVNINTLNTELNFGRYQAGYNYFNGKLDDIGIWNRALTADEVLALYNGCNVTPQVVGGNTTPGAFSNSTYTCNNNAGSTYNWTVTNGVIVSGQGTNSVTILWGAEGVGSVTVAETTADGCVGDEVIYDVNVQCVVSGTSITGPVGPEAFSNSTYTCNGAANSTYNWTVNNGVISSGQGTNTVNILWASTGLGNVSVVETTAEGCVGTTLSQDVVVVPVNVEEFSSSFSLFPNPATTEINLQTTNDLIGSDLIIFDALGKQIHKQQILSTNTRINTSAFAAGNYVVKVGGVVKRFEVKK
jgi:hypothetical protein